MSTTVENILALVATLPGLYGVFCFGQRLIHTHKMARWVKAQHADAWQDLHWLARQHEQAAAEVLITKGVISGATVEAFQARDDYLNKATWLGLLGSFLLVLIVLVLKLLFSLFA